MRVSRKVKIGTKWVLRRVPMDKGGRLDTKHVLEKGKLVPVTGGTFYLDTGHGKARKHTPCGTDAEAVKRAMRTQAHVLVLRSEGMVVDDAPEIVESRRLASASLSAIAKDFKASPPAGFTPKTVSKYRNAYETFAESANAGGVFAVDQVTRKTVTNWIDRMQNSELLDASSIVPKVRIVLAELKDRGNDVKLQQRDLPTVIQRERETYTPDQLEAFFAACTLDEYELFQTYLVTGMRKTEGAFCAFTDINPAALTVRVTAKKLLGFIPKAYHERTIPVPAWWVAMMQRRAIRLGSDGVGLAFATSTAYRGKGGRKGGKADKKILEKMKAIARRGELNCGQCSIVRGDKVLTCATEPICRVWGVHKLRHTYATWMIRDNVDPKTLSGWLGHKDLATTLIYVHSLEAEMSQELVEHSTVATRFRGTLPEEGPARRAPRQTAARAPRA